MAPYRSVLICATPRSGTTLLCDLLAAAGVGRPNSFYRRESVAYFAERWGVAAGDDFERRYLDAAIVQGRGGTDLFAMRLMWPSLPEMVAKIAPMFPDAGSDAGRIATAFGTPLYVHVAREDKIAQAVSRMRAEQSGLWHRHADGSERERVKPAQAAVYDAAHLEAGIAEVEAHEEAWRRWFAEQKIVPLDLTYEALAADPAGSVARIFAALGRDPAVLATIAPRTSRLADAQSSEWVERYRREH